MKIEKDEFVIDGGKSAMMTMKGRPLCCHGLLETSGVSRPVYIQLETQ